MKRTLIAAIATIGLSGIAPGAHATLISAGDIADDGMSNGLNFEASGGDLGLKTVAGVTGVGVTGGFSGNEIDADDESITMTSKTDGGSFHVKEVNLAFLFDGPEFNDLEEIARLTGTLLDGGTETIRLQNQYNSENDTFATILGGDATLGTVSEATGDTAATAQILDLFSRRELTSLTFTAEATDSCGAGDCTNPSDFSIQNVRVPVPGTLALLGAGLLGLGVAARRRTAAA